MAHPTAHQRHRSDPYPLVLSDLKDDPVLNVTGYSKRTPTWNKYWNTRFGCSSTNDRYRVLKDNDAACPREARLREGNNSLCCTSKLPNAAASHPESLLFLRRLKYVFDNRRHTRIPNNMGRVLTWLVSPTNNSDVVNIALNGHLEVAIDDGGFLDLLKLAIMTESSVMLRGMRGITSEVSFVNTDTILHYANAPRFAEVVGVVNMFNTIKRYSLFTRDAQGLVRVFPVRATTFSVLGRGAIDISNIASFYNAAQMWNSSDFVMSGCYLVKRPQANTENIVRQIISHQKNQRKEPSFFEHHILLYFHSSPQIVPLQVVPPGFVSVTFVPGMVDSIVSAFYDGLEEDKRGFVSETQMNTHEKCTFEYGIQAGTWMKFQMTWNIPNQELVVSVSKV